VTTSPDIVYRIAVETRGNPAAFEAALRSLARADAIRLYEELQNHFIDDEGNSYEADEIDWSAASDTAGKLGNAAYVAHDDAVATLRAALTEDDD
jgi:hypothetical protein